MNNLMLGLFNLGGGEIILILVLLSVLIIGAAVLGTLIFLIVRLTQGSKAGTSSNPPARAIEG